jgi:hypothetical protein
MKTIIATLGTAGIKLSAEASPEAVCQAIQELSVGKVKTENELSTAKAELITVKGNLSKAEGDLKALKDAQAKALSEARDAKVKALKEQAVTEMKLTKAEIEETDPAKQSLFVRMLSLEDLSYAEQHLSVLPKKVETKGVEAGNPGNLSTEEAVVARARELTAEAVKNGKKLSHTEALAQAKAESVAKGGK